MDFSPLATIFLSFIFLTGLFLIIKGGDAFVDAASSIAERSGMPPFLIGATIVSLATTLPELIVSVIATAGGHTELAVGNALGSITANTGLILALCVLIIPCKAPNQFFLNKSLLLLCSAFILFFTTTNGYLHTYASFLLIIIFIAFLLENIHSAKKYQLLQNKQNDYIAKKQTDASFALQIIIFILAALAIALGAELLVESAKEIALRLNISHTVIAVTIVALGTALPELITTLNAIIKKQASLSVGNILGANIIDTTVILPICQLVSGNALPISAQSLYFGLPVFIICVIISIVPTIFTQKFARWQGLLMLIIYILYMVFVTM